jgi:hypothetical protein
LKHLLGLRWLSEEGASSVNGFFSNDRASKANLQGSVICGEILRIQARPLPFGMIGDRSK